MDDKQFKALTDRLVKQLAKDHKLIAAGWIGFRLACLSQVPPGEGEALRAIFYAGAAHMFAAICNIISDDEDKDVNRMEALEAELAEFRRQLDLEVTDTKGTA